MTATTTPTRRRPSLLFRAWISLKHGSRIMFGRFPEGYDFRDLAAMQDGVDGPAFERMVEEMRRDPTGRQILQERPELSLETVDWAWLSSLPVDSFGYNAWHHFYSNGILQPVDLGEPVCQWDEETEYVKARYRTTHDIRHVLTGVGIEGYEEVILQAFQLAQLPQILSAGIALLGGLKHAILDRRPLTILRGIPRAWRLGRRVPFLLNVRFEDHYETPLHELRDMLGIEPLGDAYPVRERHPHAPWSREQQREHFEKLSIAS